LFTERFKSSGVSPTVLLSFAALLFFASTAHPQTVPYITDITGEESIESSIHKKKTEDGDLCLIGTFKLFNPDTVPFYLWVSYENGGKLTHTRSGDKSPAIRLVDLELHYKNALQRPMVKEFPRDGYFGGPISMRRRSVVGTTGGGSYGLFGKKKPHQQQLDDKVVSSSGRYRDRGMGAVEIVFWKEDAQPYYEMELWGVPYAPDLKVATVAGRYVENIKFEVELAR
jgi:hypothetical protein